jgi:hypothetical protein
MRGKITRNKISNEIGQIETQIAGIENQVQKASKQEAKRLKKKASQPQSTTDFLNMTFTPPKRDIVQMLTPQKERQTTELTPYKGQQSTLDFLIGGTPQKTPQQLKTEKDVIKLKELKHSKKPKHIFEYNDMRTEITGQPNPNKDIAKSILGDAIKRKAASEKVKKIKTEVAATKIQSLARGVKTRQNLLIEESVKKEKQREDATNRLKALMKNKLTKQFNEAKKELKVRNTGKPLVVNQNTKQLILKENRDRGIKARQTSESKKRSAEQEKMISFATFMLNQNGAKK